MTAYYNEHDKQAAAWLRELIKRDLVAPGDVDTRSIEDVKPSDLTGHSQCHFFAGIGGWSLALRIAGWPDDRPVWTGSCPCQPFSAAGKGRGTADERHLWPAWLHLIRECRPEVVFGEQVDAAIRHGWLDLVSADLEGIGYACGFFGLPAACVGAPHIRQRLWFVADAMPAGRAERWAESRNGSIAGRCIDGRMADASDTRRDDEGQHACSGAHETARLEQYGPMGDPVGAGLEERHDERGDGEPEQPSAERASGDAVELGDTNRRGSSTRDETSEANGHGHTADAAGFWDDCEWLPCRDGKARPVEPGVAPLAHGIPARVVRLRGYGNAIVPQVAAEVIEAYMEGTDE